MSVSPDLYRKMVDNSADAIVVLRDYKIVFANAAALKVYNAETLDELLGRNVMDFSLLNDIQLGHMRNIAEKLKEGSSVNEMVQFKAKMRDDSVKTFEASLRNITLDDVDGLICIMRNISWRQDTEKRLKSLHDSTALLGQVTTREEAIDIVLSTIKSIFGKFYAAVAFVEDDSLVFSKGLGKSLYDEMPLSGKGITVRAINNKETQVVNDVESDPDYVNGRFEGSVTGSELDVPVLLDGEPIALITIEEEDSYSFTTEEVQLVEILADHFASALGRIRHSEEMKQIRESHISELIGGVDKICVRVQQDLKGPLGSMRNSSYIIRHNPELASEVVDNIDRSIELISNTLAEMKEITNPTEADKGITDIFSVLKAAIDLSYIPRKVKLVNNSDSGFLAINMDKEKIQRVFFNLITNAVEAMPKGGTLTISHEISERYIEFTISDTGEGIPSELMDQLYVPFFSTKPSSLGLGLSFCKLALESAGGRINIDSTLGEGTEVTIRLPR